MMDQYDRIEMSANTVVTHTAKTVVIYRLIANSAIRNAQFSM